MSLTTFEHTINHIGINRTYNLQKSLALRNLKPNPNLVHVY